MPLWVTAHVHPAHFFKHGDRSPMAHHATRSTRCAGGILRGSEDTLPPPHPSASPAGVCSAIQPTLFYQPNNQASVNFGLRKYQGKDGVKRLFKLLLEEFGEETAGKRQIALLFALLDSDQPVENIKSLMGETDNSSIVR